MSYSFKDEEGTVLVVFSGESDRGCVDVLSGHDGHSHASPAYVRSLPAATAAQRVEGERVLRAAGYTVNPRSNPPRGARAPSWRSR